MFEDLKVIVKLGEVPEGDTITKKGGTNEYIVRERLDIYNEGTLEKSIPAGEGCRLLVGGAGHVNIHGVGKEVVWHTSLGTLLRMEEEREERDLEVIQENIARGGG